MNGEFELNLTDVKNGVIRNTNPKTILKLK